MFGEKVNAVFNSRIFRIIFSLLLAIALWFYVEYFENDEITSRVIRVTVEFINDELLADRGLIITEKQAEVSLQFSGKRSNISKLNVSGAVRVIADLADINSAGINRLQYYESYTNDIDQSDLTIVSRSDERISVVVESASKKEIPVVPKIDGQIAMDGYQAEAPIFSPETIAVTGPKSEIESIKEARVNIQRENLTKTVTAEMDFVLINTDGEEVTSDLVVLEREKVTVTIPISRIKEIPLAVSLLPGAGATDENTVWAVDPPTITVSGDPEELDSMNTIPLTTIDLASFESYFTDTYSIILPNEITNVTGVTSAEVTVSIKGLETKPLTVPLLQNVQFTNETEGYTTSLITTELEVMVRGTPEELETINEDNIRVIVDMQELGASTGVMQLPVRIRIDGDTATSCGAILDYKVTVRVTKDNGA